MSRLTSLMATAAAILNLNASYERIGYANANNAVAAGAGTVITGPAAANTKTTNWIQIAAAGTGGATVNDIAGIVVFLGYMGGASNRALVDIGIGDGTGGGTTILIPDINIACGTGGERRFPFPLNIPAGSKLWAKLSANAVSVTCQVKIRGEVRNAQSRPCFNSCESIVPPTALTNAVPNTVNVTFTTAENTNWTTYKLSTVKDYGALVTNFGLASSTTVLSTNNQPAAMRLGLGGSGTTDAAGFHSTDISCSTTAAATQCFSEAILKTIAAGSRLAVEIVAATAAANDIGAPQIWGCF